MNRRTVIRQLILAAPALWSTTSLLSACNNGDNIVAPKVTIVGAGAAGLYAAWLLKQQNIEVQILEASPDIGGRLKVLTGFSDFSIELGAEEVHGQYSVWHDMMQQNGATFVNANSEDYYFLDGTLQAEADLDSDSDLQAAFNLIDNIGSFTGADISASTYIQSQGIAQRVRHVLAAQIGNENGTSNSRIGMTGLAQANGFWSAGDQNFLLQNKTCIQVLTQHVSDIILRVKINTPIVNISYNSTGVLLTDAAGNVYNTDYALLTVPITVLKDGDITFTPPLPVAKTNAVQQIGMDRGMKIILRFNQTFWETDTASIYGIGYVPEFWATGLGRSAQNNVLTAFVHGENAEYLSNLGESAAVALVLTELDQMFGANAASNSYVAHYFMDWGAQPFIRGTYSYPKVGTPANARNTIAAPVANRLFFAGEATHTEGHFGTVHGALETAERAVAELLEII